ncbi:MAG: SMC-Scp complex subunit ScpB [Verrucomicrobiota bacterium]|jgi:segregation and condensation protein B
MEIKFILESLLFSAQRPMSVQELRGVFVNAATEEQPDEAAKAFKKIKEADLAAALEELAREHDAAARSYRLVCVAGAWQFVTQPEFSPWLKALVGVKNRPPRLSQAALETLAIIAYRQPVTRAEVEQVRGVNVDGTMQTLLERALVEQSGRAEVVGRPALYSTTPFFLQYFGLRSLEDLPAADELRRIPIDRPPAPVTAEPGLATLPPEQLQLSPDGPAPAAAAAPEAAPTPPSPAPEAAPEETNDQ